MGFDNPSIPWSKLEGTLSGRRPLHVVDPLAGDGDGGDAPAWSRKRAHYEPPAPDPPYPKPARRSAGRWSGRDPGKQPGAPGTAMPLVDNPNETIICDLDRCIECGGDLSGAPVTATARRQVTDVRPPPPPWVTEYQIRTRACPCWAARAPGPAPAGVTGRAQYGPGCWAGRRSCCVGITCRWGAPPG